MKTENDRILPPTEESDEAMTEYGRQLAMDGLLQELVRRGRPEQAETSDQQEHKAPRRLFYRIAAAAACLLIGLALWLSLVRDRGDLPDPLPNPPMPVLAALPLAPGWVGSSLAADVEIPSPGVVILNRGELHVKSVPMETAGAPRIPLEIRTPNATATATGTEFYIGTHEYTDERNRGMKSVMRLTRSLVLSGVVTLATAAGVVSGEANDLLTAEAGKAPVKHTVEANSAFAVDLYKQLSTEEEGKNIFFSPYSIMNAFAMTAEGARGKTAEEMGKVLRFPDVARRVGEDAQLIPWRTALIHSGFNQINTVLNPKKDPKEVQAIKSRMEALRAEIARTSEAATKAGQKGDRKGYRENWRKNSQAKAELAKLAAQIDQFTLKVANAVWAEKSYRVEQPYRDAIEKFYRTGAFLPANFIGAYDEERQRINVWVEEQTQDRIKDLIPENGLDSLTRMVLVNAIYFKGEWATPFLEKHTKPADFSLADGSRVKAPIMRAHGLGGGRYGAFNADGTIFDTPTDIPTRGNKPQCYPARGGFTVASLPYKGEALSMVLLAPVSNDGLPAIEDKLTAGNLSGWIKALKKRTMRVKLPRFKMESDYQLHKIMPKMGMVRAFTDPRHKVHPADFTGIHQTDNLMQRLYIKKAFHKGFLEVNEKGSEAAAATAVVMAVPESMPATRPFIPMFAADRPFLMLIRHNATGTILFMGRVMDPVAGK